MALKFDCFTCGEAVSTSLPAGEMTACHACGSVLVVPESATEVGEPAAQDTAPDTASSAGRAAMIETFSCPHCQRSIEGHLTDGSCCPLCGGRLADESLEPSDRVLDAIIVAEAPSSPDTEVAHSDLVVEDGGTGRYPWLAATISGWGGLLCLAGLWAGLAGRISAVGVPVGWLAGVMAHWLSLMHSVIGDYGLSLVLLGGLVQLLALPLAMRRARSMARLQRIQPELQAIRERYQDDKEQKQRELMELMRKHKCNPLGGCVLHIPASLVLGSVVRMVQTTGEPQESAFLWGWTWIRSLAAPDRLFAFGRSLPYLGDSFNLLPFLAATLGSVLMVWDWRRSSGSWSPLSARGTPGAPGNLWSLALWWIACLALSYTLPAGAWLFVLAFFAVHLAAEHIAQGRVRKAESARRERSASRALSDGRASDAT
ncbi:YidC/Oxa1 family membrane protein insertase [Planctomycetota bacterium]